jgi:hypothetical protein
MLEKAAPTKTASSAARRKVDARSEPLPWARGANLSLGIWLQVSAFAWPHTDEARLSAWLPGLLISIVALLSMSAPPMRWLNAFLAGLLLLWTYTSTANEALTYWNGIIVGLMVLIFATIPSKSAASDFRD